jgi:ribonuclease-3
MCPKMTPQRMRQMENSLDTFEDRIGYAFSDKSLLQIVLTHRSFLNESRQEGLEHNERLEFLGDAVLELVVTEYLYRNFSNPEGELTNWRSSIVKGEVLAKVAKEVDLGQFLRMSKGEEKSGGQTRSLLLANAFEALIGGIYLDSGYDAASKFINNHLIALLPEIIEKKLYIDAKSRFQELCQERRSVTPEYKVMGQEGPDHERQFKVGVYAGPDLIAQGEGSSKQRAEQAAAAQALEVWQD